VLVIAPDVFGTARDGCGTGTFGRDLQLFFSDCGFDKTRKFLLPLRTCEAKCCSVTARTRDSREVPKRTERRL
jgi:hypothetical protein